MMSALSLSEVFRHTGDELIGDASFNRVSIDTRTLQKNDLYVALSGENFDGNEFVKQAEGSGAVAAITSYEAKTALPVIKVKDTRLALGLIARTNRRKFLAPLIALTGSAGKTTTKEMISSILADKAKVLATRGNLNNEVGVPLTLLEINTDHHYAVVEMGASRLGDIAYLCQFAEPTIALLTNVMPAHLEGFGDVETIAKTKGEIFESLSAEATAVINYDSPYCQQWCSLAKPASVVTFSLNNQSANYYSSDIRHKAGAGCEFVLHTPKGSLSLTLALLGAHNVQNAVAAAATAMEAGASLENIKHGLEKITAVDGRLKLSTCGDMTIIDDSYNANPSAVMAAIDVLSEFVGKRCLVLGTMGELADQAEKSHKQVAAYARDKGIEQLVAVGDYAGTMCEVFGFQSKAYRQIEDLLADCDQVLDASVVLIKGSRSARMERLLERLQINDKGSN
jgi:UDP-N-acetylmuramoyl-tripeptide--D-alanyl-D-alanine ligase